MSEKESVGINKYNTSELLPLIQHQKRIDSLRIYDRFVQFRDDSSLSYHYRSLEVNVDAVGVYNS